jgi:hypothetical protein
MDPNKTIYDFIKVFFQATWKEDKKEYWCKLTDDHLRSLAHQIELFMIKEYINPETVVERVKPLAELNDQLQSFLRTAIAHAKRYYNAYDIQVNKMPSGNADANWNNHLTYDEDWSKIMGLLKILELYDPERKEKDDALLENNGG